MRIIPLAVIAAAMLQLQASAPPQPPLAARVVRVTAVASGVVFDNPVLHLKGIIEPAAGRRLQIVEIALGAMPVHTELATFRLVSAAGDEFTAIAVGGGADT